MLSHQINQSNLIETNDGWNVQRTNDDIIFILVHTFSRLHCETSFVLGFVSFL